MKSILFRLIIAIPLCFSITALSLGYAAPYFHPERFWFLPFIGLIYPVSLILTFVLTVIALWARLKIGILGLIILVFGMGMHMRLVSLNFTKSEAPEGAIKVLSYNVRLFGLYDDPSGAQKNGIFNFIRKESPDIACFQEYFKQDKPTTFETFDSLNAIIKSVDFHERSAHRRRGRKNFGIAIFSKYKMISKGDITFDNQGEMDFNYCIYADIVTQKDTFRIYNVHLQSIRLTEPGSKAKEQIVSTIKESGVKLRNAYLKRAGQSRKVLSHIQKSPYPVIVCGDFNDTPISYTYQQFNSKLTDAFRATSWGIGSSYLGRIPAGRIDYFFYSDSVLPYAFKTHDVHFSDHRPITCSFTFE